jgi:hypothetical protein
VISHSLAHGDGVMNLLPLFDAVERYAARHGAAPVLVHDSLFLFGALPSQSGYRSP